MATKAQMEKERKDLEKELRKYKRAVSKLTGLIKAINDTNTKNRNIRTWLCQFIDNYMILHHPEFYGTVDMNSDIPIDIRALGEIKNRISNLNIDRNYATADAVFLED